MSKQLQFAPFSSTLDGGFWHKLSQLKLNVYGLDDSLKTVYGFYTNGSLPGLPCCMNLDYTAFDKDANIPRRYFRATGALKNTNRIDEFKTCDKKSLLEDQRSQLWNDIRSGKAIAEPDLLSKFYLLTYADLKKFHYYYWFAFPAVCFPEMITLDSTPLALTERFSAHQVNSLLEAYNKRFSDVGCSYFVVRVDNNSVHVGELSEFEKINTQGAEVFLAFCDPCNLPSNPGWPMRNLLALTAYHWAGALKNRVEVICFRDRFKDGSRSVSHSIVLKLHFELTSETEIPKCVGWEKNERQKLGPRMINLSSSMDPVRLATSAVDLNLKLMRWRLLPDLNLEKISSTRCLLLGAGTLGCNVARNLMGWGVRHITLVDNGVVSYSNPVRQSLFVFEDSLNGGKPKAEAAAAALTRIFPGVNATGISLSIPMPGHSVSDTIMEQVKDDVKHLEELIENHDVVFLLMDTRESRWLPTVIGAAKHKIVMNAALGFDSFLIVRHGVKGELSDVEPPTSSDSLPKLVPGSQLGCYFCNDVVAPGNSSKDRTLDQQCTVSRPGMSMLAGALVVELTTSLLLHAHRGQAAASTCDDVDIVTGEEQSPLGIVPHQMRGFLSRFQYLTPTSKSFDRCTACSNYVVDAYNTDGFEFLLKVFNESNYLEDLTGLTQLHTDVLDDQVWELSDDESI